MVAVVLVVGTILPAGGSLDLELINNNSGCSSRMDILRDRYGGFAVVSSSN